MPYCRSQRWRCHWRCQVVSGEVRRGWLPKSSCPILLFPCTPSLRDATHSGTSSSQHCSISADLLCGECNLAMWILDCHPCTNGLCSDCISPPLKDVAISNAMQKARGSPDSDGDAYFQLICSACQLLAGLAVPSGRRLGFVQRSTNPHKWSLWDVLDITMGQCILADTCTSAAWELLTEDPTWRHSPVRQHIVILSGQPGETQSKENILEIFRLLHKVLDTSKDILHCQSYHQNKGYQPLVQWALIRPCLPKEFYLSHSSRLLESLP